MSVTKRADTGRWRGRYYGPDGKQRSRDFDRKADAVDWLDEQKRLLRQRTWTDPDRAKVTVAQLWPEWTASKSLKPRTQLDYENLWQTCIEPTWGSIRLDRITPSGVAQWVAGMTSRKRESTTERPIGPARKRKAYSVFAQVLDLAVADGRLPRNPARIQVGIGRRGVLPPLPSGRAHRYLTHGDVSRFADAMGDYRTFTLLLAYTGLRWGEAIALRVCDVDPMRARVRVERAFSDVGGVLRVETPKTHQSRDVSLPGFLREPLTAAMAGKSREDLIFTAPEGGPLRYSNFRRRVFDTAVKATGLEGLTPHGLRHTAASLAVASGASVKGVQRMLGHADAAMTLNVYADLFDGELDAVAARLDAAFRQDQEDSARSDLGQGAVSVIFDEGQSAV
jgi:integrase